MRTELVDISATRKEIKIDIDATEVRAEYDRVSNRYMKIAAIPGFRPGRAPSSVVRRHYKNEIRSEVLRELLPQAVAGAIEEHKLNPLAEPDIHLENTDGLEKIGEQPLLIHAQVEVLPEVKLGEYKGIEVTRRTRPIGDEEVDLVVETLRQDSASLRAVEDRGAQLGDTVTTTFHGKFVDPPAAEDINVEDVEVVLGGPHVLPEMTDNLLGVTPDEERSFTLNIRKTSTRVG
ncbi:MAG: trigger factor [Pyrinomonadaceae bacterium]